MISTKGVKLKVGHFAIDVSVDIESSEYFVLLGMTGSGKTLFLESLCGLREIESGSIQINNVDVTKIEPKDRRLGYVPQDGALFEHLSVADNIGFSLSVRNVSKKEIRKRVEEIAGIIGISHLIDRKIKGLSGGERQRVALSRALASNPSVLIMDEPVSALDEYTREAVCRELKRIQRELKISVIHVCHSFEEAKLVGDRIGIMHGGSIIQSGKPMELLNFPIDITVARILRLDNIFDAVSDGKGTVSVGNTKLYTSAFPEGKLTLVVRPWELSFSNKNDFAAEQNIIRGRITEIMADGFSSRIRMEGELQLIGSITNAELLRMGLKEGAEISVQINPKAFHFFKSQIL
ncbi:MAG: ABC transporter ATP-binding protein [Fibrobacteres bacterium]|nr:ABC transporter ATP-binding protein [Fibrobacterota bacterium]